MTDNKAERNAAIRRGTMPGKESLFRGKVRAPVSITLTPAHHTRVKVAMARLRLSRADLIGLLIEKYASIVTTDGLWPNDVDSQPSLQHEDHPMSLPSPASN